MGSSQSNLKPEGFPPIDHFTNTGIPSPHYPPPSFNPSFQTQYCQVLQHLYYGQRLEGISAANSAMNRARDSFPLEYAIFVILRCLLDQHGSFNTAPTEIAGRRREGLPQLEGDIATVAEYQYNSPGEYVLTRKRKVEDMKAGVDRDPLKEQGQTFFPFLVAVYSRCHIVIGQSLILSDVQVLLHILFYNYISSSLLILDSREDSSLLEEHRKQQPKQLLALCAYLRLQRRVDLELFIIRSFREKIGFKGLSINKSPPLLIELRQVAQIATNKHQIALCRYCATFLQWIKPIKRRNERFMLANAFRECGDIFAEAGCRLEGTYEMECETTQKLDLLKATRINTMYLRQPVLTHNIILTELRLMLKNELTEWADQIAVVDLLRVWESNEALRLGSKYHSHKNGSVSSIYNLLSEFLKDEGMPIKTRMFLALYAQSLMNRFPPVVWKGVGLAEGIFDVYVNWMYSWHIDISASDGRNIADQAKIWLEYTDVWSNIMESSKAALFYEDWMIYAARNSSDSIAGHVLEMAERSAISLCERLQKKGEWLAAIKHAMKVIEVAEYHVERPGPPIENHPHYGLAQRICSRNIAEGTEDRSTAEQLLYEAKSRWQDVDWETRGKYKPISDRSNRGTYLNKTYDERIMAKALERGWCARIRAHINQVFMDSGDVN